MARKVSVYVDVELTLLIEDDANVDDIVRGWADSATMSDIHDEDGKGGDVCVVEFKSATVLDSSWV